MSDVVKLPKTPGDLKKFARKRLDEKCEEYLNSEPMDVLLLTKADYGDINAKKDELQEKFKPAMKVWWDGLDDQSKYKDGNIAKLEEGMRGATKQITDWLEADECTSDLRVGAAPILGDYMKYLLGEEKTKMIKAQNDLWATMSKVPPTKDGLYENPISILDDAMKKYEKVKDKYLEALQAHSSMTSEDNIGGYQSNMPDECKPNLFNTRKFVGEELKRSENQVRIMHWNILADGLAGSGLSLNKYAKSLEKQFASPKESLNWDYRKWLILEEIAHYNPDIITLVELDGNQDYYGSDKYKKTKNVHQNSKSLQYYLKEIGYKMDYKAKDSKFAEMGTGFFWKEPKLNPVTFEPQLFKKWDKDTKSLVLERDLKKSDILFWKEFSGKGGQIFSMMRFKTKGGKNLAVCTVHLQSDKTQEGEDERAMQIWEGLYWLNYKNYTQSLKKKWSEMGIKKQSFQNQDWLKDAMKKNIMDEYAVILTGDFNAERGLSVSEDGKIVRPLAVSVPETVGFKSFYDEVNGGDLPWTSWKKRPAGRTDKYTIDYVFGSKGKTKGLAVLGEVPEAMVDKDILLPNYESGSDHISLVVDFEIGEFTVAMTPEMKTPGLTSSTVWIIGVAVAVALVVFTMLCWMFAGPGKQSKDESSSTSQE